MPSKHLKPLELELWIRWQRFRSCLKVGVASGYLSLWFLLTQPLKARQGDVLIFVGFITVFWGYLSYQGLKAMDHHIITPLNGLLWSLWIVLALSLFLYTAFRQ